MLSTPFNVDLLGVTLSRCPEVPLFPRKFWRPFFAGYGIPDCQLRSFSTGKYSICLPLRNQQCLIIALLKVMSSFFNYKNATALFLHPRNKSHLIMVCDLSDVLLKSACDCFLEEFCIYAHQECWPIISCKRKLWTLTRWLSWLERRPGQGAHRRQLIDVSPFSPFSQSVCLHTG